MSISDGYEPRWDIDLDRGEAAQSFAFGVLEHIQNGDGRTVEVKRDDRSQETGNVYIEYECERADGWNPSGIAATEAKLWVFVLEQDQLLVAITVERLKDVCRTALKDGRARKGGCMRGSHPTRGVILPITDLLLAGTRAMRSTLIRKYG